MKLILGAILIIMILLASCQPETELTTIITPSKIATESTQVETPSPVATSSMTVVGEPITLIPKLDTPTATRVIPKPIPSQTLSPTKTMTPTPWSTLLPDEAVTKVLSLLQDNNNPECLLPCWWGATPGQTQWQDIESFLNSFAIKFTKSSKGALVKIPLPESVMTHRFSYVDYGWNESGIIHGIYVDSINIPGYDPRTMMTLYGIPDEVWLKTFGWVLPGDVLPFHLILVYQEQGISFRYYVDASSDGETVHVCFEPGYVETERPDLFPVGPRIHLWEPGQHKTVSEITNNNDVIYYPLEEKTGLTLQMFYEKFTNPSERPCINTPADLWDE